MNGRSSLRLATGHGARSPRLTTGARPAWLPSCDRGLRSPPCGRGGGMHGRLGRRRGSCAAGRRLRSSARGSRCARSWQTIASRSSGRWITRFGTGRGSMSGPLRPTPRCSSPGGRRTSADHLNLTARDTPIGAFKPVVEVDAAGRVEIDEHLFGPDLLECEHVWLDRVDDPGECRDLVVIVLLGRGSELGARREQVLDIPGHHRQFRHRVLPDRPPHDTRWLLPRVAPRASGVHAMMSAGRPGQEATARWQASSSCTRTPEGSSGSG